MPKARPLLPGIIKHSGSNIQLAPSQRWVVETFLNEYAERSKLTYPSTLIHAHKNPRCKAGKMRMREQ